MNRILSSKLFAFIRLFMYAVIFVLFITVPIHFIEERSFCIFYNLFEIKCPGCGMTRAFSNVFHGNIMRAINYNKFIVAVFPLFLLVTLNDSFFIIKRALMKQKLRSDVNMSIVEKILYKIYREN